MSALVHQAVHATTFLAYACSCALLHGLLQQHYAATCSTWLSVLFVEASPYCALVRGGIRALQFAPLLAVGTLRAVARPREE